MGGLEHFHNKPTSSRTPISLRRITHHEEKQTIQEITLLNKPPYHPLLEKTDIRSWFSNKIIYENNTVIVIREVNEGIINDKQRVRTFPRRDIYSVYDKSSGLVSYTAEYQYREITQTPELMYVSISDYWIDEPKLDDQPPTLVERKTIVWKEDGEINSEVQHITAGEQETRFESLTDKQSLQLMRTVNNQIARLPDCEEFYSLLIN